MFGRFGVITFNVQRGVKKVNGVSTGCQRQHIQFMSSCDVCVHFCFSKFHIVVFDCFGDLRQLFTASAHGAQGYTLDPSFNVHSRVGLLFNSNFNGANVRHMSAFCVFNVFSTYKVF